MKNKRLLFTTAAMIFAAAVFAGPDANFKSMPIGPGGPGMRSPGILSFAGELELTGAQMEKLITLEKDSSAKSSALQEDMKKLMDRLRDESEKDSPDEKTIDAIIDRIAENHRAFMKQRFIDMQKIKAVLTKAQFKKLKKLMTAGPAGKPPVPGTDFIRKP